jgi:hypothetical protein
MLLLLLLLLMSVHRKAMPMASCSMRPYLRTAEPRLASRS